MYNLAGHNAWGQAWQEIGNDPENEVIIITGTGSIWQGSDESGSRRRSEPTSDERVKIAFDAMKILENLIYGIDVPTIAAVNGPSPADTEFALACDITICTETATFLDPHYAAGVAPGDGLGSHLSGTSWYETSLVLHVHKQSNQCR